LNILSLATTPSTKLEYEKNKLLFKINKHGKKLHFKFYSKQITKMDPSHYKSKLSKCLFRFQQYFFLNQTFIQIKISPADQQVLNMNIVKLCRTRL
jgi:hypothetical protein